MEAIAIISLVAGAPQLLKFARPFVIAVTRLGSAPRKQRERRLYAKVLLSLINDLRLAHDTLEYELLLYCKKELELMAKNSDEKGVGHESGNLKKIGYWWKSIMKESTMDRTLVLSTVVVMILAFKNILQENRHHGVEIQRLYFGLQRLHPTSEYHTRADLHTHIASHGTENIQHIASLTRMGLELRDQGHFEDAHSLHEIAFSASKQIFGDSHSKTYITMNNLAIGLQVLGRYDDAHELLMRVFEGCRRCFGDDHAVVLSAMCNVAISYQLQNRLEEAKYWHTRCCKRRRKVLGEEHSETLISWSNLAVVAHFQGDLEKAEQWYYRAATQLEINLGLQNPDTIIVWLNLARCLKDQSRYTEAESITSKILRATRQRYGNHHWQTLMVMKSHAIILHWQGRLKRSLRYATHIRNEMVSQFGRRDPRTQSGRNHVQQLEEAIEARRASRSNHTHRS